MPLLPFKARHAVERQMSIVTAKEARSAVRHTRCLIYIYQQRSGAGHILRITNNPPDA